MTNEFGGHKFANPALLDEALTHPSLSGQRNYQRLEFIGDRVLGFVVSTWLYEKFPNDNEGKLNGRFIALVRKETLAEICRVSGLVDLIHLTDGAKSDGAAAKDAVQSDVVEAVIGAMYLDGGIQPAQDFIMRHLATKLEDGVGAGKDNKTKLQEWAQARGLALPSYKEVGRSGPDHSPVFKIEAAVAGFAPVSADGQNKRIAQQAAAAALLDNLQKEK